MTVTVYTKVRPDEIKNSIMEAERSEEDYSYDHSGVFPFLEEFSSYGIITSLFGWHIKSRNILVETFYTI